jgi:hypothetical protein
VGEGMKKLKSGPLHMQTALFEEKLKLFNYRKIKETQAGLIQHESAGFLLLAI